MYQKKFCVLILYAWIAIFNVAQCSRETKMSLILETLRKIEEHMTKEDRLREIADIVRIDNNVDKINIKLDRVLTFLDISPPSASGRISDSNSLAHRDNMEVIQTKLQNLEVSVNGVEETMKKLDFDPTKVEEIERRTTQLKDDMNAKLRKMMNVLTALYELNKEMKQNAKAQPSEAQKEQTKSDSSSSSYAAAFLLENLDELEKKMKEQFSIMKSEFRSEVTSLKFLTTSAAANCQSSDKDDDEWMTSENARSSRDQNNEQVGRSIANVGNTLDNLMESLGRSTREIRSEIKQGIQGIDSKLLNLTLIAKTSSQCDSFSGKSGRSILEPVPQQSIDSKIRVKAESCSKIAQNVHDPKSCADLRVGGATCDGIYVIFPKGIRAVRVYCDMTTDGGGWSLLMRRGDFGDKMTSFDRNWASYRNGFGDTEGEFWIGNEVLHHLTNEGDTNQLRVHMESFDGDSVDLDYASFSVGNETSHYRLQIGPPIAGTSQAAISLRYHNNKPFSTFDRKNDNFNQNCAQTFKGGWWFNGCYFGFLTGEYFGLEDKREDWQGMLWYDWKGNHALKAAQMMIRPADFGLKL